jgi:hypothetical protein
MFNFFKRKTKIQKLQQQYENLMKESFNLSKINRTESDKKFVEAELVMSEIKKYSL